MAALVIISKYGLQSRNVSTDRDANNVVSIEYGKQYMFRNGSNPEQLNHASLYAVFLTLENNGSANYNKLDMNGNHYTKNFSINGTELRKLKALVLETGFIHIPEQDGTANQIPGNYTKYQLKVTVNNLQKVMSYSDPSARGVTVPPIVTGIAGELEYLLSRNVERYAITPR